MITNLIITEVPKEPAQLKKLLEKIGDHTWSQETIEAWEDSADRYICYYAYYSQFMPTQRLPSVDNISIKTFEEVLAL